MKWREVSDPLGKKLEKVHLNDVQTRSSHTHSGKCKPVVCGTNFYTPVPNPGLKEDNSVTKAVKRVAVF